MDKTLYDFENEDLSDYTSIEKYTFKKAVELNDKLIDVKTLLEEIDYDWTDFINYLEDNKISKYCEFKGETTIDFDEELLNAIVSTLRQSLINVNKAAGYNSKKIKINRAIDG
ncbi:MAG: hypothetical protein IJ258_09730 [Methanobrevibacter sp.]|uniref:hypothetical protein n=1 Tax=Methanobrevibacter sp. TaxID=66852 RepID=UPI0025CE24A9|nr:hypothetical protein [Methanobrevibacter sp.]MBQ8018365.1 hypothetical protein [Methanobrevibacter sp.]